MLYKIDHDSEIFVPLKPTSMHEQGFMEKKMENWLAANPGAVLPEDEERIMVISQETPFENMTDIVAVDVRGNLAIIEVKRGQSPRDVIAQALEYSSDVAEWDYEMLNGKALDYFASQKLNYPSLLAAFEETFNFDPGDFSEDQFNQQQRIFIIGERIGEKIERTARWLLNRGLEINCLSYTCYLSQEQDEDIFLDIEEIVRPLERQGGSRKISASIVPATEEEAIESFPESLKEVYLKLRNRAYGFGDVQSRSTKNGLIFRGARNFAEIQLRRQKGYLLFYIRPEGFSVNEKESEVVYGIKVTCVPDSYRWTLTNWFIVDENTDLDAATKLLRQSYDAVQKYA